MKTNVSILALSAVALAVVLMPVARAQVREAGQLPAAREEGPREQPALSEVTFLGISTHRVDTALAEKMKLPRDRGLLVSRVMAGSPAEEVLKPMDLLTHLEGQTLTDPRQLGLLVRSRKERDVVQLTLLRAGKPMTVRAKLGKREMPPLPAVPPPVLP
jgi:hypothetical protein